MYFDILAKMDQYLLGKCNLMYILILDEFVKNFNLCSEVQSYLTEHDDSKKKQTNKKNITFKHANTRTSRMLSANVVHEPRRSAGSATLCDVLVYLFDFLFATVGAEEICPLCSPPLCIDFLFRVCATAVSPPPPTPSSYPSLVGEEERLRSEGWRTWRQP